MSDKGPGSSRFRRTRAAASTKAGRYERPITLPALDSSWRSDFTWNGLERLAWLIEELEKAAQRKESVRLDFGRVTSVSPLTIVMIAGAIRRFEHDRGGGTVRLDVNSMTNDIRNILQWAGFLKAFRLGGQPLLGRYLPLREDRSRDMNGILDYVFHSPWMGSDWISRDSNLQQEILTAVSEIYFNAFDHAESPIGVLACGEYDQIATRLRLSVMDFGIGIPGVVRTVIGANVSTREAMEWAFTRGNTTAAARFARGVGFSQLQRFVNSYRGELVVSSRDGRARLTNTGVTFAEGVPKLPGTLVTLTLRRRNRRYPVHVPEFDGPWF